MSKPQQHAPSCPLSDPWSPDYGKAQECRCRPQREPLTHPDAIPSNGPISNGKKPSLDQYDGVQS